MAGAAYNGQTGVEKIGQVQVVIGQKVELGPVRVEQVVEVLGAVEVVGMEVLGMGVAGRQVGGHLQMKKTRQVTVTVGKAARPGHSSSSSRGKTCGK